jgi:predicted RNA-binding protein (TIGR00451 family)
MEELRRIAVGEIQESQSVKMEDVVDAMWLLKNKNNENEANRIIHTPETFIFLPKAIIRDSAIESIKSGAKIAIPAVKEFPGDVSEGQKLKLFSESGIFIGVGIATVSSMDLSKKNKGIAIKLERVHV